MSYGDRRPKIKFSVEVPADVQITVSTGLFARFCDMLYKTLDINEVDEIPVDLNLSPEQANRLAQAILVKGNEDRQLWAFGCQIRDKSQLAMKLKGQSKSEQDSDDDDDYDDYPNETRSFSRNRQDRQQDHYRYDRGDRNNYD